MRPLRFWFYAAWWRYLLGKSNNRWPDRGLGAYLRRVVCRARGHPAGIVFFNPGGLEPNMSCRNCGEDAS